MSNIRVTHSGLISLAISLVSFLPAMIFMLIVTRTLTPVEFGAWNLINNLMVYVIVIEPLIAYWVTREITRNIESGKTALLSSGIFSIIAICGYMLIVYFIGPKTNVNQNLLFFAAIVLPPTFLNRTLTAINLAWKPHAVNYGSLVFVVTEIPMALIFIYILHMGILGVIITISIAYSVSNVILFIYARDKFKSKINLQHLKKWIKLSWVSVYPQIGSMIMTLDVIVFSIISGSMIGIAFWSVSAFVSRLISNSGLISNAVYAKLLQEDKNEYLQENVIQLFYFAIPFATLVITFSRPALFVLNPLYVDAIPVIVFLTVYVFFNTLSMAFQSFLKGIEKVDINEKSTFKDYVKSKLFLLPTISLIQYGVYISSLSIMLLLLLPSTKSPLDLVIYWSILALAIQIPFTIYFYILIKRNFVIRLPFRIVAKYLLVSIIVFGFTYVLSEKFLDYKKNIFEFLPDLFLFVVLGLGSYLIITYLIDFRTRKLINAVIKELKDNVV